jgi:hypothetical protein
MAEAASEREELCLSELYALLQSSVSTLDESPHKSIDTLTLLMEQICSQQEALQMASPPEVRLQVNATWIFVIDSILKSKDLQKGDWKVVCETIVAVGNVLYLYGLVDFPNGFAESELLELILTNEIFAVVGDENIGGETNNSEIAAAS